MNKSATVMRALDSACAHSTRNDTELSGELFRRTLLRASDIQALARGARSTTVQPYQSYDNGAYSKGLGAMARGHRGDLGHFPG